MPDKLENRRIPYFGDFVLFDEIGRGGMGVVYSAQQTKLDRPVALKVLHSSFGASGGGVQRLRIEAEATARLDHPNIVPVFEFGEHEGHPYLAMQLIVGQSLAERMAGGKVGEGESAKETRDGVPSHSPAFSPARSPRKESAPPSDSAGLRRDKHVGCDTPRESAALVAKIARAVHHAHQRGVLHRDLKPGNILVDDSGEPHLIDFGLAKCVERDSGLTQTGTFLGTPAYASPEQAAGQNKSVTTASDTYNLGGILYALLTGQPPFVGESAAETIEKVKRESPRRLRSIRPSLSADLEIICHKCLEKEPARRYVSALALAEELERFLDGRPIAARAVGAVERLGMWTRRNPVHAALAITVCLVVLGSIAGAVRWREVRAREAAARSRLRAEQAEAQSQLLRRQLAQQEIAMTRLRPRSAGWFSNAFAHANEASGIPGADAGDLRDQTAALFAGMDARQVLPFPSIGAASVIFDREGTRLLAGGLEDGAKLWEARTGQVQTFPQTNSGPLAFANGSPMELR